MDPNANLKEIRELLNQINYGKHTNTDLERLADLIEVLDEWISNGGVLPNDWKKHHGPKIPCQCGDGSCMECDDNGMTPVK